jgi:hypothetical protein
MLHFIDEYADQLNRILHTVLNPTWFYKQEVVIFPDLVTAVFVTYDGVRDDSREIREVSWDDFVKRIRAVDPDWDINPEFMQEVESTRPAFGIGGWLCRTIYLIKAGQHPEYWTADKATEEVTNLMMSTAIGSAHAKAMAGLPEYVWLHSFRKSSKIQDVSDTSTNYQLFEILQKLVKKARIANLAKLEMRLRNELLRNDANLFVRGYVAPRWADMKQAFTECSGQGYSQAELPYRIMGKFLHHMERNKSMMVELAKLDQLV